MSSGWMEWSCGWWRRNIWSSSFQVIAAEGEQKAAKALKDAADIINESQSALQLRYLQTLGQIASEKNSTIIFPMPIELIKPFNGGSSLSIHEPYNT